MLVSAKVQQEYYKIENGKKDYVLSKWQNIMRSDGTYDKTC